MRMARVGTGIVLVYVALAAATRAEAAERYVYVPEGKHVPAIDRMPDCPKPFDMRDWKTVAQDLDKLLFNFDAKGQYLPLIWLDDSRYNFDVPGFGLQAYVGKPVPPTDLMDHEGVSCMAAVLAATVAGIDKTQGRINYVEACIQYYNRKNGENIITNKVGGSSGEDFWYDVYNNILFYGLVDRYPKVPHMEEIMRLTADKWFEAFWIMGGRDRRPDFNHTGFSFKSMRPNDGNWMREPDAAGGVAWLQYMAYMKFKDTKYLYAADASVRYLQDRGDNPYYENLMPFGALVAAGLNMEQGRFYDVPKFLNWCFDGNSKVRDGWGLSGGRWGNYDCYGLTGGRHGGGEFVFAMNTWVQLAALTPIPRYDPRYAKAIAKYVLNCANASRLFYPYALPQTHQSTPRWTDGDPEGKLVCYEGLRKEVGGKSPYLIGDAKAAGWAKTDLAIYGAATVGFLGGIVSKTADPKIIRIDLLATDFFHPPAYPSYLYYNPYTAPRVVRVDIGPEPKDVYDTVGKRFVAKKATGSIGITLPVGGVALMVLAPPGGKITRNGSKVMIDGVVVDYYGSPFTP